MNSQWSSTQISTQLWLPVAGGAHAPTAAMRAGTYPGWKAAELPLPEHVVSGDTVTFQAGKHKLRAYVDTPHVTMEDPRRLTTVYVRSDFDGTLREDAILDVERGGRHVTRSAAPAV